MSKQSRSLVTGALGFVGSHLVRALAARGDDVIASDLRPTGPDPDVEYAGCDVTDDEAMSELVSGCDVVFHVASLVQTKQAGAKAVWAVNLGGTENVIAACRKHGVKRLIYVSSASVVYEGRDIENGDETLPYAGTSQAPYADSKIAAERAVLEANDSTGLRTCAIRPHVVYGPGDGRFLPAIVKRARAGKLRTGVGKGVKLSDFTFIDNLIDGLLAADEHLASDESVGGQSYFVTNGEPLPFWDFVDKVLVEMGQPATKGRVPFRLAWTVAALAEGWNAMLGRSKAEDGLTRFAVRYMCTHHYFSIETARRDFGYEPAVSIDEGIRRTIAALEAEG